ncbi:hypothetical protein [Streptomyces cavernicola]|uniref:Uncharacterized protein n=1 Tax=Streptomyces cavernicola TaxID=3043613 RepID=A0ABT6SD36_9ACTN|nr:hypothetical protein [Streptomyces sp. B-S-A6]MDI3405724.1 hypothetical protein [Streptomyces sp. B-S-A6]
MYDRAGVRTAPASRLYGTRLRWARGCLTLLTLGEGLPGAWALLWPRGFYDNYPAPGHPWVAALPPYNEHLVRDFGAGVLALSVVLAWAACTVQRRLVQAASVAALTLCVSHLAFHSAHLGLPAGVEEGAQLLSLTLPVVCAVAALLAARRTTAPPGPLYVRPPGKEEVRG